MTILRRSLKHLVWLLDEVQSLGVGFVSWAESIDCTTRPIHPADAQQHIADAAKQIADLEHQLALRQ